MSVKKSYFEGMKLKIRNRRAPLIWQDVFIKCTRTQRNSFNTKDIRENINDDCPIKNSSLQVKLAKYVAKGYLSKKGRDSFFVTERGKQFFNIPIDYTGNEEDYMTYQ